MTTTTTTEIIITWQLEMNLFAVFPIFALLWLISKHVLEPQEVTNAMAKCAQIGECYTKKTNRLYGMYVISVAVCVLYGMHFIYLAQSVSCKRMMPRFAGSPNNIVSEKKRLRMVDDREVLQFVIRHPKQFCSNKETVLDPLVFLNKRFKGELINNNEFTFPERQMFRVYPSSQSLVKLFGAIDNNEKGSSLMNFEWARYATYKTFPIESPAMPSRLAASGFFYTEESDIVMCFSCNLKYGGWKFGDDPSEIHIKLSPRCLFINNSEHSNVPIHESNETTMQGAVGGTMQSAVGETMQGAVGGTMQSVVVGFCAETDGSSRSEGLRIQQQNRNDQERLNTGTPQYKYPEYADIAARRSSFMSWPSEHVTVEELVKAGFFYAGFGDCVRCFSCGGGLKNWQYGDTPLEEHRTWFPTCIFLLELGSLGFHTPRLNALTEGIQSNQNAECRSSTVENTLPAYTQSRKVKEEVAGIENTVSEDVRTSITEALHPMGFGVQAIQACISSVWNKNGSVSLDTVLEDLLQTNKSEQLEMKNKGGEESLLPTNDSNTSEKQKKGNKDEEPSQIEEENSILKSQIMCKICMDRTSNVVFRPCGHMVSCDSCSQRLRKCALCRQLIEGRIMVFNGP